MTPEEIDEQNIAAIRAHRAGKPVECKNRKSESDLWILAKHPSFNLEYLHYRPKPEPVTRDWTAKDVPPVCWIRERGKSGCGMVSWIDEVGIAVHGLGSSMTHPKSFFYRELSDFEWTTDRINWRPCTAEVSQ